MWWHSAAADVITALLCLLDRPTELRDADSGDRRRHNNRPDSAERGAIT